MTKKASVIRRTNLKVKEGDRLHQFKREKTYLYAILAFQLPRIIGGHLRLMLYACPYLQGIKYEPTRK
jgi:hypothetical protein